VPNTVLIIDDDRRLATAIRDRLVAAGFAVVHAERGITGLEQADLLRPDLIILDIRMPDIDGFEVCATLRQRPGLRGTPVLFLSADSTDLDISKARQAGGDYFMSKPYCGASLVTFVRSLTASHAGLTPTLHQRVVALASCPLRARNTQPGENA
jgi:DNA-binding response OmpR family regulator